MRNLLLQIIQYLTHSMRNKKMCYPPLDLFSRWLFQRTICIVYLLCFLQGDQKQINLHLRSYNQSHCISYYFSFRFLQNFISHSINHLIIWHLNLWCICTLWSGVYQNNNTTVIRIIDKKIITGEELLWKNQVFVLSSSRHIAPHIGEIFFKIFRL